jgi:hypothetical protein
MNTNKYIKDMVNRFKMIENELKIVNTSKPSEHDIKRLNNYIKSIESFIDFAGIDITKDIKYVAFQAEYQGKVVRITAPLEEIDIVSWDNTTDYNVELALPNLIGLQFESVYDG